MNNRFAKLLSGILVVIMLFGMMPALNISAAEESDAYKTYELFQADAYALDDVFNVFMIESYNHAYVDLFKKNTSFQVSVAGWELTNKLTDPSSWGKTEYLDKMEYYQLMLFDLLNAATSQQDILDVFNNKYFSYIASVTKSATKLLAESDAEKLLDGGVLSDDVVAAINSGGDLCDLTKAVSNATKIISFADSAVDYIQKMARYQIAYEMNQYQTNILLSIRDNTDDYFLQEAIDRLVMYQDIALGKTLTEVLETTEFTVGTIYKFSVSALWSAILGPLGGSLNLVITGTKLAVNEWFGTDAIIEAYYAMKALDDFEVLLKNVMINARNTYLSNRTEENAKLFLATITMYERSVLLGCDYIEDVLDAQHKKAAWDIIFGSEHEMISQYNVLNDYKNTTIDNYSSIEQTCYTQYKKLYSPDEAEVLDYFTLVTQTIPITGLTCNKKELTIAVGEGAYASATCVPSNSTETRYVYSSDNSDVVSVDSLGYISGVAEGTATITIKSASNKDAFDTMVVTVSGFYDPITGSKTYYDKDGNIVSTEINKDFSYSVSDGTATITGYTGRSSIVAIPTTIDGYSVTQIGYEAFENCGYITRVLIPSSVTSIGYYAFYGCSSLTSITIPSSVTSIDNSAFDYCTSLKDVYITDITAWCNIDFENSDSNPLYYADNLYLNNVLVTNLVIPEGVTSIGDYVFRGCESLESITIPEGVTSIGDYAFYGCSSLTSITIPEGVTSIGYYAFYGCSSLTSITIPQSVTSIDNSAFYYCTSLEDVYITDIAAWCNIDFIDFVSNPLYYADNLYLNNVLVTNLVIPEGVTSIGDYVFRGCESLESITLSESVTSIGEDAFYGCESLESITIPSSVTSIGEDAFSSCSSLESIVVDENNRIYDSRDNCNAIIETATSTLITGCKNTIIPEGVTSIGDRALINCESLKSITIPEGVKSIGDYAFYGCTSLESVTILEGVASIGDYAFKGCTSLESITIPSSVTSIGQDAFKDTSYYNKSVNWNNSVLYIGSALIEAKDTISGNYSIKSGTTVIADYAFYGCKYIKNITIPEGVTSIGDYAFYDCESLSSITIPEGVTSIGDYAFYGCSSLTSITIPEGVTIIGYYAFYGCSSLTSITIPQSVTNIGNSAFYGTAYYKNAQNWQDGVLYIGPALIYAKDTISGAYTIKEGTTVIADYAFKNCTSLEDITIPKGVTSIGDYAFYDCESLSSITIPEGVTSIGIYAFYYCSSLSSITIPEGVTNIGDYAFYRCYNLESITIPSSVTSISNYAFYYCSSLSSITIPERVTSIGNSTFEGCTSLSSITIPEGVTSIGRSVFDGCTSLSSITIPSSVTSIDSWTFAGCTSLKDVYITDIAAWCNIDFKGSYPNPLYYADNLYLNGELVKTVVIPQGVTKIPRYAFSCRSLSSITIPSSVTSIDNSAFDYCTSSLKDVYITDIAAWCNIDFENSDSNPLCYADNLYLNGELVKNVVIPQGVTKIPQYAFSCRSLSSITIPSSVTSIGDYAFYSCYNLESIKIPEGVTTIGDSAFYDCESLSSITIPEGVTSIGNGTFEGCTSLSSITIPEGVTSIGDSAFYNCTSLSIAVIPEGVTSIGEDAFSSCSSLESIVVDENNRIYDSRDNCNAIIETATNTLIAGCKNTIIPSSVISIGDYAFYGCTSLSSITIPEGVTSIGDYAFYGCSSLTSITIPEGVTRIGYDAFNDCTSLEGITIPSSVTRIDSDAFVGCTSLENVYITDVAAWCGIYFYNNASNPLYYADNLYLNNVLVTNLVIPEGVTSIGDYVFRGCESLESITIPEGVTSIGRSVFDGCTSLKSISIPSSVTSIGYSAFNSCYDLTHVFYGGSEVDWNNISINGNYYLTNATRHYNASGDGLVFSETVEPSCTAGGYDLYCCSACDYEYRTNLTEALGHNVVDGFCTNCGLDEDLLIESLHPYKNNTDESWTISKPSAKSISVAFSEDTETESYRDYIYIYDADDNQVGRYSGTSLAGETITVSGDTVRIRLTSNGSITYFGFALSNIVVDYEDSSTEPTEPPTTESPTEAPTEEPTQATDPTEKPTTNPTEKPTQATDPTEPVTTKPVTTEPAITLPVVTEPTATVPESTDSTDIIFPEDYIADEDTDIAVAGDTADAELVVSEITRDKQIENIDLILVGEKVSKVFDITLQKDGVEVQPDGKVMVRIPAENPDSKVYRMETDGTLTNMNAVYFDGYLIFTTEHFSVYVVAEPKTDSSEPKVTYLIGDANSDGKINVKDATQIQKSVAGLVTLDDIGNLAADSDQNEKVNVKDATAIQKFVAGISVNAPVGEERKK